MNRVAIGGAPLPSQTRGDVVARACDVSVDSIGEKALYLTTTNKIIVADVRSGYLLKELAGDRPRVGVSFARGNQRFVTLEFTAGSWKAVEYDYVTMAPLVTTDLAPFGVTSPNSCRYSASSRYICIAHSTGALLLDTRNYTQKNLQSPLTGNILNFQPSWDDASIFTHKATEFQINQIGTGLKQEYFGFPGTEWDEIHAFMYNWDTGDELGLYPDLFVAGKMGSRFVVHSYSVRVQTYTDDAVEFDFPEEVIHMEYSQVITNEGGGKQESTYGRALAVFGKTMYKVYNVTNGDLLAEFTYSNLSQAKVAVWGMFRGPYT